MKPLVADGSEVLRRARHTPYNTYQAPGVKRTQESYDVGFRRLVGFREGSVVGL